MTDPAARTWSLPNEPGGLRGIANRAGIAGSVLPNGSVFALEHHSGSAATLHAMLTCCTRLLISRLSSPVALAHADMKTG